MLNMGDMVYVVQSSITKEAFEYYSQVVAQSSTGSLFSVPPANVKSNLVASDGKAVLGLFTVRDLSISNAVIIDNKLEKQLRKRTR